jgi:hypothetical protein
MINERKLKDLINKESTDLFIRWDDTPTIRELLKILYENNYNFVGGKNYDVFQPCWTLKDEMERDFFKFYHGNSKPILHIFFNHINGKNEIQFTTQSITKTYPQYRNSKVFVFR